MRENIAMLTLASSLTGRPTVVRSTLSNCHFNERDENQLSRSDTMTLLSMVSHRSCALEGLAVVQFGVFKGMFRKAPQGSHTGHPGHLVCQDECICFGFTRCVYTLMCLE